MKTAVVTGASGGIGAATAAELARRGYRVYGLCRGETPEGVRHVKTDVTDDKSVASAFALIASECDSIDLLINNAGMGISGAIAYTEPSEAEYLFQVNFFGGLRCAQAALPLLKKGGRVINVSSAAAIFAIPFQAFYSASKSAVNSLTLAMRNEFSFFGVSVCAVMPGDVKTGFTAARRKSDEGRAVYGEAIEKSVAVMERDERGGMTPEYIAGRVCAVAERWRVRPLYTLGAKYRAFAALGKLLPASVVNWLVGKLYIVR